MKGERQGLDLGMFYFPMTICVAWSLQSSDAGRFGSPGWAGAALGGRKCPQAGRFWARSCASLRQASGWQSPVSFPGSPQAVPRRSLHALSRREAQRDTFPPFSFRCPRAGVQRDHGCVPPSLSKLGCFWRRRSPLCCRKPWFGALGGGTGAPRSSPAGEPAPSPLCRCPPKPH